MIIRRLTKAMTEQNWFVVFIEILVVVIGTFIGLQVDGWNDSRKDRLREHRFLERIYDELAIDIESIQSGIESAKRRQEMGQLLLHGLDDPEVVRGVGFFLLQSIVRINANLPGIRVADRLRAAAAVPAPVFQAARSGAFHNDAKDLPSLSK